MNRRAAGSARGLLAWIAMFAGFTYLLHDIVRLNMTGLALLGVVLIVIALWLLGVFRPESWISEITEDHPDALGSLDLAERAHRQDKTNGTDIQR